MHIVAQFHIVLKHGQRLEVAGYKVNVQADLLNLDVFFGDYLVMTIDVDDVLYFDVVKDDVHVKVCLNQIQGCWRRFDFEAMFNLGRG